MAEYKQDLKKKKVNKYLAKPFISHSFVSKTLA